MEKVTEKSVEVKSGVFFQVLNSPKLVFRLGLCPGPRWGAYNAIVGWGGGHLIPFPQLLQPQLLNNWLSGLTLFFINMKQRLLTISVNTRYWVIFACLYWKSQGTSCGLESGHREPSSSCQCKTVYICHVPFVLTNKWLIDWLIDIVRRTIIVELHVQLSCWVHRYQLWGWCWWVPVNALPEQCHVLAAVKQNSS